jgi:hypothetical protein
MREYLLLLLLAGVVLLSGCIGQQTSESETAVKLCIDKCKSAIDAGQDISNGPCLSNEIISGWVCDVAHSPREAVDNLPENQCSAYREGVARHFVEVDTACKFIRAV